MHFIKYFTIFVLLAVQYSLQDTIIPTPSSVEPTLCGSSECSTRSGGFDTTQQSPTGSDSRKKRGLFSKMSGKALKKIAGKVGTKVLSKLL